MIELRGESVADAFVFLHEVGHTMGAVQVSAPHSTGDGHCDTAVDVMCSSAAGGTVCPQLPEGRFTFDCEGGDYYEVGPAPGSYLATHWNTAESGWLSKPG